MTLSIVIPVYNMGPWLEDCLASVRDQSFTDWEAICVDDGSTDESADILAKFATVDLRFRVIHQTHSGVSAARNAALGAAHGDWIAFVDADDTIDYDWFTKMMRHAVVGVDIVHADAGFCFNEGGSCKPDSYRTFLRDGWSVLNIVRRAAIGNVRFRERMKLKEDVVFFVELARTTNCIAFVQEKGYHYRYRNDSAAHVRVSEEDSVRFCEELLRLNLPREDAGRAIGYDLIQWTRDRSEEYSSSSSRLLRFWRDRINDGTLCYSDVRMWWRPGLWWWIKTGSIDVLIFTRKIRIWAERCLH